MIQFTLDKTEERKYNRFIENHRYCQTFTTGGKISIEFTTTSLGNAIIVKCNRCGKKRDIATDW